MDKTVHIMRGIPGSGKSTKAAQIAASHEGAVICSADDFFLNEAGEYIFDRNLLGRAHKSCKDKFLTALEAGAECVIVDNTNTTAKEFSPYVKDAQAHGYKVEFHIIDMFDVDTAFERNTHGVPREAIQRMVDRFQR